jgi:PHD/YefM family antitoxin component YafN of YafNO toxin-antitoxin module
MKRGYTVLTRDGKPVAYLFSAAHYDEEDIGYMTDPKFWEMVRQRRESDEFIPLEQVEAEIAAKERAESKRNHPRKGRRIAK